MVLSPKKSNQIHLRIQLKVKIVNHPQDHKCEGKTTSGPSALSRAGIAAMARQQQPATQRQPKQPERSTARPTASTASALQGGISEDEALRRALEASMRDQGPASASASGLSQEEQDRMLAEAIARSEREAAQPQAASGSESKNCQIS